MKRISFLVSTSSSQCPSQCSLQPEAARVKTKFFLFLSITPIRNKEMHPEFFCSRLIIKTKNVVSVFSWNQSEKPVEQSSNFLVSNSFLEGSAVIDEGDYQFFPASFYLSKIFLQIVQYLRKRKDAHFKPQSKSQRQSSCHYAVIIDIGD